MKSLLLTGGILGFVFGSAFSYLQQQPLLTCLWHGSVAGLLTGLILLWWSYAWTSQEDVADSGTHESSTPVLPTVTHSKASQS